MKTLVLFGSGNGAKEYIKKNPDASILAIFDNDLNKEGKHLENIEIFPPSKIMDFNFDNIVITSQWAHEIKKQLIEELGIIEDIIIVPAKSSIKKADKPFEDMATINIARKIIKSISEDAIANNIDLFIDFGTLLGITRDNDIILWDDDIDFAINESELKKDFLGWLLKSLNKIELDLDLEFNVESKVLNDKNLHFLIDFKKTNNNKIKNFLTTISLRQFKKGYSLHLPSGGMWYAPEEHFNKKEVILWQGSKLTVPFKREDYLKFIYGDWKKPKQGISMTDYANLAEVNYEEFKDLGSNYEILK